MKKLFGIILCLTIAVSCLAGATYTAYAVTADEETVHFVNPTAMTIVGNYLYVADNVEENKCAILIFDISRETPTQAGTYELDGTVTNLSDNGTDLLYAVKKNGITELKITSGTALNVKNTYDEGFTESIVDAAYGKNVGTSPESTLYVYTATQMLRYDGAKFQQFANINKLTDTKGCVFSGDYLYYLYGRSCKRFSYATFGDDENFESNLELAGLTPKGITIVDGSIVLYDDHNVYAVNQTGVKYGLIPLILNYDKTSISDAASAGDKLFLLNGDHKIDIFAKSAENDTYVYSDATIGSDVVSKNVPTEYTDFTLVKSKGYPTNIVYKTKEQTSVPELIDHADEYIVLGYEGDENSGYYYVLTGGKFGWVKKSQAAATVETDAKLQIADLKLDNGQVGYVTKFNSLGAVTVRQTPNYDSPKTTFTQTASSMKEVKLLKRFTETAADNTYEWYWVEYDEGQRGFVERAALGNFRVKPTTEDIVPLGDRKINSTLFEAVTLYADKGMAETDVVYDEQENLIKLYSGDRVTVISEEDGASFIMRQRSDGTRDFGWIATDRLIGVHSITTNAIVGLSLLAFAVALTVTLLVIFLKRKKRLKNVTNDK